MQIGYTFPFGAWRNSYEFVLEAPKIVPFLYIMPKWANALLFRHSRGLETGHLLYHPGLSLELFHLAIDEYL